MHVSYLNSLRKLRELIMRLWIIFCCAIFTLRNFHVLNFSFKETIVTYLEEKVTGGNFENHAEGFSDFHEVRRFTFLFFVCDKFWCLLGGSRASRGRSEGNHRAFLGGCRMICWFTWNWFGSTLGHFQTFFDNLHGKQLHPSISKFINRPPTFSLLTVAWDYGYFNVLHAPVWVRVWCRY